MPRVTVPLKCPETSALPCRSSRRHAPRGTGAGVRHAGGIRGHHCWRQLGPNSPCAGPEQQRLDSQRRLAHGLCLVSMKPRQLHLVHTPGSRRPCPLRPERGVRGALRRAGERPRRPPTRRIEGYVPHSHRRPRHQDHAMNEYEIPYQLSRVTVTPSNDVFLDRLWMRSVLCNLGLCPVAIDPRRRDANQWAAGRLIGRGRRGSGVFSPPRISGRTTSRTPLQASLGPRM